MKNKLILIYWCLIILLQSFLIYSKLWTSIYDNLLTSDFILWNVIALVGGIIFIILRKRGRSNLYESVFAAFIGINGVIYAVGNLMLKSWPNAGIGLLIGIMSFVITYLVYSLDKKSKRKVDFPLSQTSRIIVDKPTHNIGNEEFKRLVNIGLKPLLQNIGFEGKDYLYYRLKNNNIETILLGTSPYGKAICVNAEIKKSNGTIPIIIDEIEKLESISPNKLKWKRLSPDDQDCWWWFRPTEEENQKVINEIFKLISTEGENYFKANNK